MAGCFPAWWRHVLVALATLILCSCRELPTSTGQLDLSRVAVVQRSEPAVGRDSGGSPSARPQPPDAADAEAQVAAGGVERASFAAVDPCPSEHVYTNEQCAGCAVLGPSDEYLCDGGDFGLPAGVRADWTADSVEQEDTVAHYDTVDGRVVVQPSNRVCVYAPRFAAVRRVNSLIAHQRCQLIDVVLDESTPAGAEESTPSATSVQRQAAAVDLADRPASLFRQRQQAGGLDNLQATIDVCSTLATQCSLRIVRTGQVDGSETAKLERAVQSAVAWTGDQAVQIVFENKQAVAVVGLQQPGLVYETSEPTGARLRLLKLASTGHALPGELVTFTLRFDNIGDRVIGNVTIIDNLATRLEYVPESAASSVEAHFSTAANGGGSLVLRWEIKGPVEPSDGGVLAFRCKVR